VEDGTFLDERPERGEAGARCDADEGRFVCLKWQMESSSGAADTDLDLITRAEAG
jgi:hypothetical protein